MIKKYYKQLVIVIKNLIMKEIKDENEFDALIKELDETPFGNNKFKYKGKILLYMNGQIYNEGDFRSDSILEDYFHPNHFIMRDNWFRIFTVLKTRPGSGSFHDRDDDTWARIEVTYPQGTHCPETCDKEKFDTLGKDIYFRANRADSRTTKVFLDEDELTSVGFIRGTVNTNLWFYKTEIKSLDRRLPYRKFDNTYSKRDLKKLESEMTGHPLYTPDTIKAELNKAMKDNILFGVDSLTYSVFEGINYTFGVEIETCLGRLPDDAIPKLNLKAVHDGSLRDADGNTPGGEYVTGVLKGDAGLHQLYESCRVIQNNCEINKQCGVHIHCGSLNWSKEDIVYAYILGEVIQEELFSILPISRRNNSYCRKLTPIITTTELETLSNAASKGQYNIIIDQIYDVIYKEVTYIKGKDKPFRSNNQELADGIVDSFVTNQKINKKNNHPLGTKCGYDKGAQRYTWLNFVTLLYLTKGKAGTLTLEFRNHGATMNFNKIKNWIKICFAFCKFVETNKSKINTGVVSLEDIISNAYPKSGEGLMKYITERKEVFKTKDESIDYLEDTKPEQKSIKEVVCAV
jgi:hypothetical protein